jgi:hypothetical protein
MCDDAAVEKGRRTYALPRPVRTLWSEGRPKRQMHLCAIDDLVGDDEVSRLDLLSQAADSRERDNRLHSEVLESCDVSAGRHVGWR